jgi:hypothetical protein
VEVGTDNSGNVAAWHKGEKNFCSFFPDLTLVSRSVFKKNFCRKPEFSIFEVVIAVNMVVFSDVMYSLRSARNRYDPAASSAVKMGK